MISLRVRLALLLVVAIVTVVAASVLLTFLFDEGPEDGGNLRAFAASIQATAALLDGSPARAAAAGLLLRPAPAPETVDEALSQRIAEAQREGGLSGPRLLAVASGAGRDITFPLRPETWVVLPLRSRMPAAQTVLFSYLGLVVLGTTLVALAAASRLMGPLRLLEGALGSVRADGTLPPLPEDRGPPEIRQTARTLNALSARLRAAMESRMRLVAAAGHDFRTPLTRLRLRAEFLPEAERDRWLRDLEELDRIADSAIRLVREEADPATFEPCPLAELCADLATELGEIGLPVAFAAGGRAPVARAQPLALKRALRNLAENAALHGGGAVLRLAKAEGEAVVLIEDRGPGIPEALMARVFEPFFRVDAGRRKSHPGAGLGLAIAREIVERQGGRLRLANRRGGGLRQEVRLPLAR